MRTTNKWNHSDLTTINEMPAINLYVGLPNPLQHKSRPAADLHNLPAHNTKTTALVASHRNFREKHVRGPEVGKISSLVEIAQPLA